jgi:peptide deformylase
MIEIVQKENPVLRKVAELIPVADIIKPKIQKLVKDMSEVLRSQDDGVALAAPQVGESLRLFIVSGKIFDKSSKKADKSDLVFINPVLKKISSERRLLEEGCLSIRPVYGKVLRATKATIEAYDEMGKKITRGASGLLAHIFQHEIDHLEGILFTDIVKNTYKHLSN